MRRARAIETQRSDELDHRQTISVSPVAGGIKGLPTTPPLKPMSSSPRGNRKSKHSSRRRPPLSKHPKSVVSDATNSTYLSSDSEEDTVRSGELSAFSGSNQSNTSASGIAARKSRRGIRSDSSSHSSPKQSGSKSSSKSSSTRLVTHEDSPDGSSGSEVADFLLQYSDNEDDLYPPQLVSDDSEGIQLEEDDDFMQLINESSNRWRQSVSDTIQKTSTATVAGNLMGGYKPPQASSPPNTSYEHPKKHMIQEQQAEIEALRAQLAHQRITGAPMAQIEVSKDTTDLVGDDLTIWSSDCFQTTTIKRPDAASVVSKPPSPKSTTRAFSMQCSGQTVSAVFSGNLTQDIDGDYAGVGVIRFANGDVYQGEMRHSKLHGKGSYHSSRSNLTQKGRFVNGRFVEV